MILFGVLLIGMLITGCNKPGTLDDDFVDLDEVNVKTISDFEFKTKTIVRDPEVIYNNNLTIPNTFLLGHVDDPLFGETTSEIYSQIDFSQRKGNPFDTSRIDSIVLFMRYDTFGVYGTVEDMVTLSIHELQDDLRNDETYESDQSFMSEMDPMATLTFDPEPYMPVIRTDTSGNMDSLPAQIRIPFDTMNPQVQSFKRRLLEADSAYWSNPDSFLQDVFKGFHFKLDAANTMLGFNFQSGTTRLAVYFSDEDADSVTNTFSFFLDESIIKSVEYQHDYSGLASDILADSNVTESDTFMLLQEMQGLSPEIVISGIDTLRNTLINQATIEMTVAELPDDDQDMYFKPFLLTAEQYTDTSIVDIIDTRAAKAVSSQRNNTAFYVSTFGGRCETVEENGIERQIYTANITSYLQDKIDEGEEELTVLISSLLKPESPRRVVFYGADSKYPVKLKVIYTVL